MKDCVLIVMPECLEDFLWCLPVGQTYLMYGEYKIMADSLEEAAKNAEVCFD